MRGRITKEQHVCLEVLGQQRLLSRCRSGETERTGTEQPLELGGDRERRTPAAWPSSHRRGVDEQPGGAGWTRIRWTRGARWPLSSTVRGDLQLPRRALLGVPGVRALRTARTLRLSTGGARTVGGGRCFYNSSPAARTRSRKNNF